MPISIADIQQKTFARARQGYDTQAVDEFLEQISSEVEAMLRKIADLKTRLNTAENKNTDLANQLEVAKAAVAKAQQQAAQAAQQAVSLTNTPSPAVKSSAYVATEEQLSKALIAAQQTAERITEEAKANAERIKTEADTQARKVIRQALDEKQTELDEIERLKKSREEFRAEYMRLLQKFQDAAQANFPSAMLSSTPSGSQAVAGTSIPLSSLGNPSATPFGASVDTSTVDDLD